MGSRSGVGRLHRWFHRGWLHGLGIRDLDCSRPASNDDSRSAVGVSTCSTGHGFQTNHRPDIAARAMGFAATSDISARRTGLGSGSWQSRPARYLLDYPLDQRGESSRRVNVLFPKVISLTPVLLHRKLYTLYVAELYGV
jgi:hypothetical protein